MVRVNIINPRLLSDQHLVAEYLEILMLVENIRKHPLCVNIPKEYCLGKGHMKFFRNKVKYLISRRELLKREMGKRGFKTRKKLSTKGIKKNLLKNWKPKKDDKKIIVKRLKQKIRKKPGWYRYYRKKRSKKFFFKLLDKI